VGSEYIQILLHSEIWWLSRDKVLTSKVITIKAWSFTVCKLFCITPCWRSMVISIIISFRHFF
jgi:hypothetical protein